MSQIYNKMRIDVKEEITDIITAKQDDSNSRFLDVYLYDGSTPINLTGEEVRIYMRKPDGTEIFNNGEITDAVNGRCQFELTSQALGAVGVLKCEISIWQGNTEILTTQTFHVFVAESLRSNGSIESSNEYGALVVLFQNLYQSIDLMQDMVANFGTPSGAVDADTFWKMLEKLYEVNEAALANASVSEVLARMGVSNKDNTLFEEIELSNELINEVKDIVTTVEPNGCLREKYLGYAINANSVTEYEKVILEVNGSGKIYNVLFFAKGMTISSMLGRVVVRVEVDGVTIARMNYDRPATSSSKQGKMAILNNYLIGDYNAGTQVNPFFNRGVIQAITANVSSGGYILRQFGETQINKQVDDIVDVFFSEKPIEFKESFKIVYETIIVYSSNTVTNDILLNTVYTLD